MANLKFGVIGCGRIGKLHINNLLNNIDGAEVVAAADPMLDKSGAREWLAERGITNASTNYMDVVNNPDVDVVMVCSSTDTHCEVSMEAVKAGKNVFCEKPIDYDIDKIKKLLALVEEKGVKFQVGFNRRFDHNHKAVADAVKDGTIGDPHIVIVSSRDPEPPPASYVAVSGGIFYDMMIHDFDMVRYVTGSEAVEISAVGSCLVNPNLQEESGIPDVDTAVVTMKMANGCIAVINNSRQAVYGYDQRVEAFGSKGMASDANDLLNTTTVLTKDGAHSEKPLWFFLERYNQAFINQVISFVDAINNDKPVAVAGVMGGANSEIMDDTKTVVFESANFHGATVRITAKALGMRTEASGRFEKGLNPENCLPAVRRALELVAELAAPAVAEQGCTLWDVEYVREGSEYFLRLYIDKDGGVDINDCEAISRAVDPILDEKDPIPGSYHFEVCSAGLERVLKRPSDFQKYLGSPITVKLYRPRNGMKEIPCVLRAYEDGRLTVEAGKETVMFEKSEVALVRLRVEF